VFYYIFPSAASWTENKRFPLFDFDDLHLSGGKSTEPVQHSNINIAI
jgi:hypothetical protein